MKCRTASGAIWRPQPKACDTVSQALEGRAAVASRLAAAFAGRSDSRAEEAASREPTGIEVTPWGERSFHARDPFENLICFVDSQTLFTGRRARAGTPHPT